MEKRLLRFAGLFLMSIFFFSCEQQDEMVETALMAPQAKVKQTAAFESGVEKQYLRHVILYNFNDGISEDEKEAFIEAISGLETISEVRGYEWGQLKGEYALAHGFTHAFIFTFDNLEGLGAYANADKHVQFVGEYFIPFAEDFMAIDYFSTENQKEFEKADFRVLAMHKEQLNPDMVEAIKAISHKNEKIDFEGGMDVSGGVFTQGYQEAALISFDKSPRINKWAEKAVETEDLLVFSYKVK